MKFLSPLAPTMSALCLALALPIIVFAEDWRPVDPSHLALKSPVVEKDADAEAIFWEVRIDDSQVDQLTLKHHVRVKVFTERGKESQSKVELPYFGTARVTNVAARVIKNDGTVVQLKKDDVFDRTIVKTNGMKIKAKSFALPGVEVGSIVEYRWDEVHPGGSANQLQLRFQREIPAQEITYYLKPFMGMRYQPFHMGEAKFVKDKDNFYRLTMNNMPAFREEPRMLPEDQVRAWVLLYYSDDTKVDADKYWKNLGKKIFENTKDEMKVDDEVKNTAATIIGNAATAEEKLKLIYDFCRTQIKNTSDDASGFTPEQRRKLKENKSPSATLKSRIGSGADIDMLFAALAKAAGFDARFAASGNRSEMFFQRSLGNAYFLRLAFIAVRVDDAWKFFSPAGLYTPFGMLPWPAEAQEALITDPKEPFWVKTGMAPAEKSREKRTAKFQLLEDGTLEGDVRIEYTGHVDAEMKEFNDEDSASKREETLRDLVKSRLSTAELSNVKIESVTDPLKPFVYEYHVRIPGYAQLTGKRLFLQPGYFERGVGAAFPRSDRKHLVYFNYPWSEEDEIEILLPAGYSLESPDVPSAITSEMTKNISSHSIRIFITKDKTNRLIYQRKFVFGGPEAIVFPVEGFAAIKGLFDRIHKADNHTLTLKQAASTASAQ